MAIVAKMYGNALSCAMKKEVDWVRDDIRVMLCTSSYVPNQDTHVYKDISITDEVVADGYAAGGNKITDRTITYVPETNTVVLSGSNVTWADSSITARYAIIYNNTPTTNKPLLGYIEFDKDYVSNDGDFVIKWDATGIFNITAS